MDYLTGDLGRGGGAPCAVELCFRGRLGEPFLAFVVKRANRLSLKGWTEETGPGVVTVAAEGPKALIDALEIACSLGPIDSDVESWSRRPAAGGINTPAFSRRDAPPGGKAHRNSNQTRKENAR